MTHEDFVIRPYRMKRLKHYCSQMSQDNTHVLFDNHVAKVLSLQGFSTDEAPRSVYKVEKLYEALEKYNPKNSKRILMDEHVKSGVSLAYASFAKPKGRPYLKVLPITPATIAKVTSKPTASAGLTNYGCTKAESELRALERGIQTIKGVKAPEPCLAFKRTQFNDKTRLVWGYPYSMTVIEGLFAYNLNEQFKKGQTPMAFAIRSGALGTKLRVASYHSKYAYSIDMSSFDASISAKLIHIAFDIIETWFDLDQVEPQTQVSNREIIRLIRNYFIHTPIVMPNSKLYLGKSHGVPSGSYFTQIVDSIVNVIVAGAISSRFRLSVDSKDVFVLGDDLLFWCDRKVDLDRIAEYVNTSLHIKMHGSEKSAIYKYDEPVHYLGRDWSNGIPSLSQDEILKRMIYPESYRRYSKDPDAARREVKLLILAYASVYKDAWHIAQDALGNDLWNSPPEALDREVYVLDSGEVKPQFFSGLTRYQLQYQGRRAKNRFTTTALQFWM